MPNNIFKNMKIDEVLYQIALNTQHSILLMLTIITLPSEQDFGKVVIQLEQMLTPFKDAL